jgi:O-antigen ligase
MLEGLTIFSVLIWLPLLFYQMMYRGFFVLTIWLLVAPVVSNVINSPGTNPFFPSPSSVDGLEQQQPKGQKEGGGGYFTQPARVTIKELLEPTRLLFGAFFLLFLGRSLMRNKLTLTVDKTETWMLIFSLVALANVTLLSNRFAFGTRIVVDAFIVPFLAYFTARRLVLDDDRFSQFIRIMSYLGCFLIIVGLVERISHPDLLHRVQGPFVGRDYLYVVIMAIFFIVVVDALSSWFGRQPAVLPRWIQLFVGFGSPVIILLTLTRGNWAGFLAGFWIFAFLARTVLTRRQKLASIGLGIGLVPIIFLGILEVSQTEAVGERINAMNTIIARLNTYTIVINAGRENPIFGIGLNNLRDVLRYESHFVEGRTLGTAHSSYLAIFSELGMTGLISYLAIMWSIYRTGLRIFRKGKSPKDRWWGAAIVAMLTAYLVPQLFSHMAYSPLLIHVYLFASLGAIAGRYERHRSSAVSVAVATNRRETRRRELASAEN